jgi:hypothetical protein
MAVARISLTQLGYISEALSRFGSVPGVTVKKSVRKEQSQEVNSRSKFSARVSKCEDVESVII